MKCPNCNAKITFNEKLARIISCIYCLSILEFNNGVFEKIGENTPFLDFPTIFELGKTITYKGKNIYVLGQIRSEYDGGFFDEFFVTIGSQKAYIIEDDGEKILIEKRSNWVKEVFEIEKVGPGQTASFLGEKFFVNEVYDFEIISFKGYLNNKNLPGKYKGVSGFSKGKKIYLEKNLQNGEFRISIGDEL